MDIAFAFDEGYVGPAQVAMESVLDCHPDRDDITFWLLTTAAVKADRTEDLQRQVAGRARLHVLSTGDEFRSMPVAEYEMFSYISSGMYLRLLLPDLLPPTVERFLYLDCDVLVGGDLGPLWQIPLDGVPLAAVKDAYTSTFAHNTGVPGAGPEIDGEAPYFNSGVLLVNAPVWRELGVTERCLTYLAEQAGRLRLPDQDALNLAVYGRWLRLERRWNEMKGHLYEPTEESPLTGDVRIMHFTGPLKPWQEDFPPSVRRDRYRLLQTAATTRTTPS